MGSKDVLSSIDQDIVRRFNETIVGYHWKVCMPEQGFVDDEAFSCLHGASLVLT